MALLIGVRDSPNWWLEWKRKTRRSHGTCDRHGISSRKSCRIIKKEAEGLANDKKTNAKNV